MGAARTYKPLPVPEPLRMYVANTQHRHAVELADARL